MAAPGATFMRWVGGAANDPDGVRFPQADNLAPGGSQRSCFCAHYGQSASVGQVNDSPSKGKGRSGRSGALEIGIDISVT